MTATVLLQVLQVAVFTATAIAAAWVWVRQRSGSAALLAATFLIVAASILLSRLLPPAGTSDDPTVLLLRDLVVVGLALFPYLLALFAFSFESRLPRWLLVGGGVATAVVMGWTFVLPPLPPTGEPRSDQAELYVTVFVVVWTVLSLLAAVRLWVGGGKQPLVRARMRTLAVAAVVFSGALVLSGTAGGPVGSPAWATSVLLSVIAAGLFGAGFAPPRALRVWWRRRTLTRWQQMQLDLIAAATPAEAAAAVTPRIANSLGGCAAVIGRDGQLLAYEGFTLEAVRSLAERLTAGLPLDDDDQQVDVGEGTIVVRRTPYTPLFGEDEHDLLAGYALQLRLALERAELYEERERARRDLQRASDDLQAMLVGLAHDLQNPTVTISGYAGLLREVEDVADREEMLRSLESSADYLHQLVEALLLLARAGRLEAVTEPVDLHATAQRIADRLALTEPRMRLLVHDLPIVQGNRLGLQQILENLVGNAVKHGGRDDLTIEICGSETAGGVVIDVRDDGQGIPDDEHDLVFTPFRRGRRAGSKGSGVGLGLVRRILAVHGGRIELLPAAVGAHFRITLPSATDPTDTSPFARTLQSATAASGFSSGGSSSMFGPSTAASTSAPTSPATPSVTSSVPIAPSASAAERDT